ncbi:single-stranded DNA-binding protein [Vallicoccus soli]|uniref:Single-stranded DNA-binding protein n=1 Tax=Vallicoccus soli TaxID=2339232 RepID=A0A3A3ZDI3_9ACTN|nr:single-stranded DNA-binding protein [Vallicoccus soli]RJK93106.1 single-stranded DNA-binding protein [Vallicoccus soli]
MGTTQRRGDAVEGAEGPARNEVRLKGRLAAPAQAVVLPSGDEIATFRLVVPREPAPARRTGPRALVDTIECTAWTAALRRRALAAGQHEVLEVEGALRRRFWRGPAGASSRYGVEVLALRRPSRAPAQR